MGRALSRGESLFSIRVKFFFFLNWLMANSVDQTSELEERGRETFLDILKDFLQTKSCSLTWFVVPLT